MLERVKVRLLTRKSLVFIIFAVSYDNVSSKSHRLVSFSS
jgi:hypothetical protein